MVEAIGKLHHLKLVDQVPLCPASSVLNVSLFHRISLITVNKNTIGDMPVKYSILTG